MLKWIEYTAVSFPATSGLYMRANKSGLVESCWYVHEKGGCGWWENDEGCLIVGTTHYSELPDGPGKQSINNT